MFEYPNIDPVITIIFGWPVHWYGLMYLLAFLTARFLGVWRARQTHAKLTVEQVDDFLFYGALGVVVGGRLGYVFFYVFLQTPQKLLNDPLMVFAVTDGGMSFHGGLIGVIVAMLLYARFALKQSFWTLADFVAPLVPTGLMFGRIGNFINGELWGANTTQDFIFAIKHNGAWKHPSMLYEAVLEGLLLFVILWLYSAKPRPIRAVSGLFLLGYGLARFTVEFVRLPDKDIGYLAFNWVTMGHVLTLPMIIIGVALMVLAYKGKMNKQSKEYGR